MKQNNYTITPPLEELNITNITSKLSADNSKLDLELNSINLIHLKKLDMILKNKITNLIYKIVSFILVSFILFFKKNHHDN